MIYLDHLATTPCDPVVLEGMLPFFAQDFANAGSIHALGRRAEVAVERAREQVAAALNVQPQEIIWTSGATEANNLAIKGAVRFLKAQGATARRVITVATEHKCVLEAVKSLEAEGFEPVILPVEPDGQLAENCLEEALKTPTLLVSIMAANNETGVLHDLPRLIPLVKQAGALLHVDMVQMFGKGPCSLEGVDLASFSAHKIYGPKGVGALYVRRRPRVRLQPLFSGGGQERGLRSGTLAVPLIIGFGLAAVLVQERCELDIAHLAGLQDRLWQGMRRLFPLARLNGASAQRLPGVVNMCLPGGLDARQMMAAVPDVAFSSGSACSAASGAPSYVLQAMGLSDDDARRSLRLSVGRYTSGSDVDDAVALFGQALAED